MRIALVALVTALSGCCFVDHEQMAATAAVRMAALDELQSFEDQELTPAFMRRVIQAERYAWEIQRARLTGAEVSSETRSGVQ